jgi:hypothetical protein
MGAVVQVLIPQVTVELMAVEVAVVGRPRDLLVQSVQ